MTKDDQLGGAVFFVSGGCRSGKSAFAERLAESTGAPRVYIATCRTMPEDNEMMRRISRHQMDRAGKGWRTIEAPTGLAEALARVTPDHVVLVDCLTLWISNLLLAAEAGGRLLEEDEVRERCSGLEAICRQRGGDTIFVSNEVGAGIVPADPLTRRFRDLMGRCNQTVAAFADEAVVMISGLPVVLKARAGGCRP